MIPGDVWVIDLGTPIGVESAFRRLALIVGSPRMRGPLALVCPLTTTMRDYPWRVEVESSPVLGESLDWVESMRPVGIEFVASCECFLICDWSPGSFG